MSVELSNRPDRQVISNARIVTPDRTLADGYVVTSGDRIVDVGTDRGRSPETTIDASGRLVLPGLIDLHGDDIEQHLFPRRGARIGTETALVSCDRANVAAGVTTKFHAVAFENAPDDERSIALAEDVVDGVVRLDGLLADNRVHARCELADNRAVEAVVGAVERGVVDLVSLMNHLPERGQFDDVEQFNYRYVDQKSNSPGDAQRIVEHRRCIPQGQLDVRAGRVVRAARSAGLEVATHDDAHAQGIDAMNKLNVSISEYPVTMAAARRAVQLGMVTAMGAPNLVRGGSLWGNLATIDAIQEGVVDILCSDYHPPAILESVFVETGEPLVDRVARVTEAPADAVGLHDRGRIEPGARADLIVVDPSTPPRVERAFVGGVEVYRATRS